MLFEKQISRSLSHVSTYATSLLKSLPETLFFHNYQHTVHVVEAAKELAKYYDLGEPTLGVLLIACWFHDLGFSVSYEGHEEASKQLAFNYLTSIAYPKANILKVLACIDATKYPQRPQSLLEEIICDADLSHLGKIEYSYQKTLLRNEWECSLDIKYTDLEWLNLNIEFLSKHKFFTKAGKNIFSKQQSQNIFAMKEKINRLEKRITEITTE